MKNLILILVFTFTCIGCKYELREEVTAQFVVDNAIKASGKEKLKNVKLNFDFRSKSYQSLGDCDSFILKRIIENSNGKIADIYQMEKKLKRYVNDSLVTVPDTVASRVSESINSVHYFIQLPLRLNDNAVNKTYKGIDSIKGKAYHNIKVTFNKENGGKDYQDVYLYWFEKDTYKLDYLAYSFIVNGGGIRFREAYNERIIEGIRFVDYLNYKPKTKGIKLENISNAYKNDKLKIISKIENTNIKVEIENEKC